jgi:hypothetical protein
MTAPVGPHGCDSVSPGGFLCDRVSGHPGKHRKVLEWPEGWARNTKEAAQ